MAKFLTTVGNSFYIEQIIINSKESLTLVTPYLKLSKNLIERLSDADKRGVKMTLIYGKNELLKEEQNKLNSLSNIEIFFFDNLHAKCYHNENSMIITSMNLYEFSERNNREMGILVEKENDNEIFLEGLNEIESIKNSSNLEKAYTKEPNNSKLNSSHQVENIPEVKADSFDKLIYLPGGELGERTFHVPSLYRILKQKYPALSLKYEQSEFGESVTAYDSPIQGITLVFEYRLVIVFNEEEVFNSIKSISSELIEKFSDCTIYFGNSRINIYPKNYRYYETDLHGLHEAIYDHLNMIDKLFEYLIPSIEQQKAYF